MFYPPQPINREAFCLPNKPPASAPLTVPDGRRPHNSARLKILRRHRLYAAARRFPRPCASPDSSLAEAVKINIPRLCRGYFICGRSPMLPATPHAALVRLAICIGSPTHTGISPSPFSSHIAAIPNIYIFFFCLIIFHQQSLLLSHNLLNCFCHFILEWPPFVL